MRKIKAIFHSEENLPTGVENAETNVSSELPAAPVAETSSEDAEESTDDNTQA